MNFSRINIYTASLQNCLFSSYQCKMLHVLEPVVVLTQCCQRKIFHHFSSKGFSFLRKKLSSNRRKLLLRMPPSLFMQYPILLYFKATWKKVIVEGFYFHFKEKHISLHRTKSFLSKQERISFHFAGKKISLFFVLYGNGGKI